MKKRIQLKNKNSKKNKLCLLIFVLILVGLCTYFVMDFVGRILGNNLVKYAEKEVGRIARYVVNYAVTTENIKELTFNNLFIVTKNKNDEIQTIDFDPVVVNNVLNAVTETVLEHFKAIEEGNLDVIDLSSNLLLNVNANKLKKGIIAELPIGIVTGNALFSNLGPKIPVKLAVIGEIESELETEIKYYGINNALITVYVKIDVKEQIYMPIATGSVVVSQKIPIAIKLMQGVVPNAYFGNLNSSFINDAVAK